MVFWGMIITFIAWTFRLALIVGLFVCPPIVIFAGLLCLIGGDLFYLWKPLKRFGRIGYLKYFPTFELYFTLYVLLIPIVAVLSRNVVWKERKL